MRRDLDEMHYSTQNISVDITTRSFVCLFVFWITRSSARKRNDGLVNTIDKLQYFVLLLLSSL